MHDFVPDERTDEQGDSRSRMHVSLIMDLKPCVYDASIVCTILDPDVCMFLDPNIRGHGAQCLCMMHMYDA